MRRSVKLYLLLSSLSITGGRQVRRRVLSYGGGSTTKKTEKTDNKTKFSKFLAVFVFFFDIF